MTANKRTQTDVTVIFLYIIQLRAQRIYRNESRDNLKVKDFDLGNEWPLESRWNYSQNDCFEYVEEEEAIVIVKEAFSQVSRVTDPSILSFDMTVYIGCYKPNQGPLTN